MSVLRPLKAAYVSLYLTLGWLISLFSLWQLTQGSAWLAWLGTLLASAPLTVGISLLMLKPVIARTSADLPEFGIPTGLEVMGYETEAPMPTAIITDTTGTVVWLDETDNYRVRP